MKLRMNHSEARFLADDLELKHPYFHWHRLHQQLSRTHIVHEKVQVLVEVVFLADGNRKRRDSQLINFLLASSNLGISTLYM
jgi:hypothetical protein